MQKVRIGQRFLVGAGLMLLSLEAAAQPTKKTLIEVAVVKPHPSEVIHNNFAFSRDYFELEDQPLLKLIAFAYGLNSRQIVGATGWVADDSWDISGKTNLTADATRPQQQEIIREILVERFGLQFHKEKRELPSYALQVIKGQPRLGPAADPAAQPMEWSEGHGWVRTENYRSCTIGDFLVIKQLFLDRPLVDETGLTGRYDFKLSYSYGDTPSADGDPPPMFTAIKEQLGLKMEPVKASVDVMVIDRIGKPSAN